MKKQMKILTQAAMLTRKRAVARQVTQLGEHQTQVELLEVASQPPPQLERHRSGDQKFIKSKKDQHASKTNGELRIDLLT